MTLVAQPFSLNDGGMDLSRYAQQLSGIRQTRALNMRRSINLVKNRICPSPNKFYVTPKRSNVLPSEQAQEFTVENCLENFDSSDSSKIVNFANRVCENVEQFQRQIQAIIQCQQVQEVVSGLLQNGSQNYTVTLLSFVQSCFPLVSQGDEDFIDSGLICALADLLSEENSETIEETVKTIGVISQNSCYARDACICVGIHTMLIELCEKVRGTNLATQICSALHDIFGNPEAIDSEIIRDATPPIVGLIEGQTDETIQYILAILADLSSKLPSVVFTLFNLGMYEVICDYLQNPALTTPSLALVGNMAVAQPTQIRTLLDHGLISILVELAKNESYASDVFWVFSNLVESLPQIAFETFDEPFLDAVLSAAEEASFDAKRECAFFLATIIVFCGLDKVTHLYDQRVISLFSEVLGCGVQCISLRIIEALIAFLIFAQRENQRDEYIQMLVDNDIEDRLKDFDEEQSLLGQRASFLLLQIIQQP